MFFSVKNAVVLGLLEGITEFLPISSTGHLVIVGYWLGLNGEKAASFDVFIQLGAILAVVAAFYHRFSGLLDWRREGGFRGRKGWGLLICGTAPALVMGALLHGVIKKHLFEPTYVAWGLLIGGVAMVFFELRKRFGLITDVDELSWRHALGIGLFQCLALWPGISRSAATILGGMALGLDRKTAAEFSFLLAVPVMFAAASYDLLRCWNDLTRAEMAFFVLGFVSAFVAALVSVEWLMRFLQRHTFRVFGWYRIALALAIFWIH